MATTTRCLLYLLLFLVLLHHTDQAVGGPLEDLLPPPARQAEKRSLGANEQGVNPRMAGGSVGAVLSPDGKLLVASTGFQGMVWYDVGTGRVLDRGGNLGHNEGLSAAFTPDGKHLVTSSWAGHREGHPVTVWDAAKRQILRSLDEEINDTPVTALAVSPDGKTIALGGGWGRRTQSLNILLWDLASGDELGQITGLASVSRERGFGSRVFLALAYSPDGRTLAALLEGRVLLIEVATGKPRGELIFTAPVEGRPDQLGGAFGALAFSPDGRTLAAGCSDGAVHRFDLRSGRELTPLSGHRSAVVALCWLPDGKRIMSYGLGGQLFTWRASPGPDWRPKTGPLTDEALESLWEVLRGDDPLDLFGCVQTLAACPTPTVPFLRKRLSPVPKADTERIERLIADLQKGDYNTRKRAVVQLRKIGAAAAPALRKSQERGYDELLRRLMFEFDNLAPSADQVRSLRALRVLERVGGAEASKLLKELAGGAPEAALTVQAKAALERLGKADPTKGEPAEAVLWETLAGEDSAAAYRAVRVLANRPTAVPSLRDRLKEIASKGTFNDDPKRVAKLIAELDGDEFAVREQASKALQELGLLVVPALRKALAEKEALEPKRRLEKLLAVAARGGPPEILRAGRVLETLELMGSTESREALAALGKDAHGRWLQQMAGESLRRQQEKKR